MTAHAEPAGRATGLVLGIDGGGSRCTAVLAEADPDGVRELGRGHGGPANAVSAGFETAAANVATAVAAAFAAAARPPEPVASACLGFAGAGRVDIRDRWVAWARDRHLADRVEVVPDGVSAFGSSGPPAWGLVVVSGTGSIVWGRGLAGDLHRCGGRGGLIGDEGSGHAIAIAGLRAASRSADGWGPPTALAEAATRRFEVAAPTDLPAALAESEMTRGRLATFAPDVVGLAEAGDAEARRIIAEAAADLGGQSLAVARRLDLRSGEDPLRLTGGLLCHAPLLSDGLVAWLSAAGFAPVSVTLVPDLALAAASAAARSV
jgi:N-acetylglucosamine kinase-like BadF-type ATPase